MARKQHDIHYIYKTTCNITGKWYVGMHSTSNLDDGYMGSGTILRRSIRKHGVDNHIKEILEYLDSREALVLREIEIVSKELIGDGLCMNLKEGGTGGFSNEEHMMKCSKAGNLAIVNKLKTDIEFLKRHGANSSKVLKERHANGLVRYDTFTDKKHSKETKLLMSESSKGTGIGETNSQFGSCWITRDCINKKIKKKTLKFIPMKVGLKEE